MTGFTGGRVSTATLNEQEAEMWSEPWYERERVSLDEYGLSIRHHGPADSHGTTTWEAGDRVGVLFGAITNREQLEETPESMLTELLDEPADLLARLDGPFVVIAVDPVADRVVMGTDKLGTRRAFYVPGGPFVFGTDIAPLLQRVEDPTLDEQGLSDLLTIGGVWGDRTLIEEVRSLPSGTVLRYDDGDITTQRYWEFQFDESEDPAFVETLVDRYCQSVIDVATTLERDAGVWLSGGLDSRALAAVLVKDCPSLVTYTYDANPPGGINLELAKQVAAALDVENRRVEISPDLFHEHFEDAITLTDGLIPWTSLTNLSAAFTLPKDTGVVLEASGQAVLMGSGIWQADFEKADTAAEALYQGEHLLGADQATRLLTLDIDPMDSYREAVEQGDQDGFRAKALGGLYREYFRAGDFTSNKLARYRVGTRVPFAHGDFLQAVMEIPYHLRERTFPLSGGKVPFGCAPMKLELIRALDQGLDDIRYERTGVAPKRPLWVHALGFVTTTAIDRLRSDFGYGGRSMVGEWYRNHDGLRETIDGLLANAAEREFFDADEIRRLRHEHIEERAEHIQAIACVTTVEAWLQNHIDEG